MEVCWKNFYQIKVFYWANGK